MLPSLPHQAVDLPGTKGYSLSLSKCGRMNQDSVSAALSCDDIVFDILLRLPVESLFQLILISKRWLHLICSSSFRRGYQRRWGAKSHLLGFFVTNTLYLGRPKDGARRPRSEPALPLLSTCQEGDDLKFSGTLKQLGYFIDSSDGLLLCGRHPKTYYVWNPITKERDQLPRPRVHFEELCMAFIAEDGLGGDSCYKVIRAQCECRRVSVNTVAIETFSSKTRTWSFSILDCPSTLSLCPWTAATVIKGVIHWFAEQKNVAIYDPNDEEDRIALVKLPGSYDFDEYILGESSDGLLQYGLSSTSGMQIWVLEKNQDGNSFNSTGNADSNMKWNMRYRVNFKIMWKKNPTILSIFHTRSKETLILSFLPQNSESVYIRCGSDIFLYHHGSEWVEEVRYQGSGSSIQWDFCKVVPYFRPTWPHSSLCLSKRNET